MKMFSAVVCFVLKQQMSPRDASSLCTDFIQKSEQCKGGNLDLRLHRKNKKAASLV